MSNYAIIDNYSGFVWGVQEATSPIEACRLLDEDIGGESRTYTEGFDFSDGYIVYEAPADFDVDDGQDDDEIERVQSLPEVARIGWEKSE